MYQKNLTRRRYMVNGEIVLRLSQDTSTSTTFAIPSPMTNILICHLQACVYPEREDRGDFLRMNLYLCHSSSTHAIGDTVFCKVHNYNKYNEMCSDDIIYTETEDDYDNVVISDLVLGDAI